MEHNLAMSDRIIGDPLLGRHDDRSSADEHAAFDISEVYRDHRVRLTRLATAITLDRGIAEDVVQDAFAGLHRNAAGVNGPGRGRPRPHAA